MADVFPTNTDISASLETPGVYFQVRTNGGGSALDDAARRVLIWGYKTSSGTIPYNTPTRCPSVNQALTLAGQGSDAARLYQAFASQAGNGSADVYLICPPEPAGSYATRKIIVAGSPTTAGSVDVYVCGYLHSVRITTSDTATTIGAAIAAAINANANLPCTAGASTGTVTLTYRHYGLVGNDLPIMVNQTDASGITFSPGTLTYATSATGAGSATLTIGGTTITSAIADGDNVTAIASATTGMTFAINSGAYPVTATASAGVITLFYAPGRIVNKMSAAIVTTTGTTATLSVGTVISDGGTARPTLTTALSAVSNWAGGARLWLSAFADYTTVGTMATHIELMQNGQYQRDQYLFAGTNDGIVTAGAMPAATTPALTGKYRYCYAVCPDSPQQGYEEAARVCGLVASTDYVPKNQDGAELHTDGSGSVPNLLPAPQVRIGPQSDDAQSALHSYGLTPIAVTADGRKVVVKLRSTNTTPIASGGIPDLPVALHLGYLRVQFVDAGTAAVRGKSLRRNGTPRTENTITPLQVKSALIARAVSLDALDLYDGADHWASSFQVEIDGTDPTKLNGFIPMAAIYPLHITGLVGSPVL